MLLRALSAELSRILPSRAHAVAVPCVAELHARHPQEWRAFSDALLAEEGWASLWPAIDVVERAAEPGVHSNGVHGLSGV